MIVLDATNKSLEIKLAGVVATNQLPWMASFVETSTSPLQSTDGTTNGATAVTLVAAPTSGISRLIKGIQLVQADTASVIVTIRLNVGGTFRNLFVATLAVGDNLIFDGNIFQVYDSAGVLRVSAGTSLGDPITVAHGGTEKTTLTNHGVLLGQGTSPVVAVVGSNNTVLHGNTGADPSYSAVVEADITLDAVTTNNVSTARHGFVPVLPNDASKFFDGVGNYSDPFDYLRLQVFG